MSPEEKLKDIESQLDSLLELKSRTRCLDELYTFALERLGRYRGKNVGKTIPSLLDGISKEGDFCDELFNFSMERQYYLFCQYIRSCREDASREYEKIGQMNEEYEKIKRK